MAWHHSQVTALATIHDVALYDLDGVVYIGAGAVAHASESITAAAALGLRPVYVTNNAARPPEDVVAHLLEFGLTPQIDEVITSSQIAADLLAQRYPSGSRILCVGGRGLHLALELVGLQPVAKFADDPVAVVQGFGPDVAWKSLAEISYAVHAGLPWLATNADLTVPTARGIAPGNGALVGTVTAATGKHPEVSGKPAPGVFTAAARRVGALNPLVVGDRLDTDIAGAVGAGMPSLLVLTGVTDLAGAAGAGLDCRPTYVWPDLRGLLAAQPIVESDGTTWHSQGWRANVIAGELELTEVGTPDSSSLERSAAGIAVALAAAWDWLDRTGEPAQVAWAAKAIGVGAPAGGSVDSEEAS